MTRHAPADSRPSFSSNRSREADFEAALLHPSETIYLRSSPVIDEVEPTFASREADAPDPIGKRSFEEDYDQTVRTPIKNVTAPSVIPPTPSTAGTARSRTSTSISGDSGGGRRGSRVKPLQAIDMHQEAIQEDAAIARKKPSIFRSPGTASSPDLATLVRLAKEARAKNTPPKPLEGAMRSSSAKVDTRGRAVSQASATASEWEGQSNNGDVRSIGSGISSGDIKTTISETSRTRSGDEGMKSVRNKAKGMLGRMFGSKDHSASAPSRIPSNSRPPVPPIPQTYAKERDERKRSHGASNADVFGAVQSTSAAQAVDTRIADDLSAKGIDKPLPSITSANGSPARFTPDIPPSNSLSPTATQRRSMHTRQPANDLFDYDESVPQTTPQKLASFSEDVNGMFSGIGETRLANELGLPPDSLRIKSKPHGGPSTATGGVRHFASLTHRMPDDRPVPVPSRTTSLPGKPSAAGPSSLGPITFSRTPSSPNLSPRPLTPTSRSSSPSSARRQKRDPQTDFGPKEAPDEDTVKGRTREISGATITGPSSTSASVRLVASPRAPSVYSLKSPGEGENEWLASPISASRTDETLERIVTPGGDEDAEEKGRRLACEFLEDDFRSMPYDKVAMFLGGPRGVNQIALRYYMQYFDMRSQNLVDSFRDLCKKLHLKAESQEIDRIIGAFSTRYFECNPTTVFGTAGVVHTVTGAMLMLNTDLHIADLSKHMSRSDFVRNAMRAVQENMPSGTVDGVSTPDLVRDDSGSGKGMTSSNVSVASSVRDRRPRDAPPALRSASAPVAGLPYGAANGKRGESSTSVGSFSYSKAWEQEAESALRDIYTNVRSDKILLPIGGTSGSSTPTWKRQSVMSMSAMSDRSRAMRSPSGSRVNALKRGSIVGSQSLLGQPTLMSDGRLSPTPSYATSIDETLAQAFAPSIGFASNLTHTVIKEHDDETRSTDSALSVDTQEDMDDDELALLGPPWAKEGILSRKLYWESDGKRARKSDWKQVFVVVQKGELSMFTFGGGAKGSSMGGSLGGGNWTTNANTVGSSSLMHSKSVALPKPGYNASRPYCFSLTLPTGEVSIYQAGTEDLVAEWVQTCNYWAARTSRQPLQGGVSNMEYGWSRATDSVADEEDRSSVRSGKSSLSKFKGTYGRKGVPADKIHINDWRPPPPATMASPLDEENQLEALTAYVNSLKDELEQHKAVEQPMSAMYTPGSKNLNKARENYKAKSQYIHTEIYKYETYLEALRMAVALRVEKQGEKKLEKSLKRSMGSLHMLDGDGEEEAAGRATPTPARC